MQKLNALLIGHPLFGLLLYGLSLKEPCCFMFSGFCVQGSLRFLLCVCVCCFRIKPGVQCSFLNLKYRSSYNPVIMVVSDRHHLSPPK